MRLNTFKIKLLIILELIVLAVVVIVVCSSRPSVFSPVKNTEIPNVVGSDADLSDGLSENISEEEYIVPDDGQTVPENISYDISDDAYTGTEITDDAEDTVKADVLMYKVAADGVLGIDYPMVSDYGQRESLIEGMTSDHKGIDFSMDVGTKLVAPYDVVVVHVGYNQYRGNWVVMYWKDGYYILYQHMSEIDVWEGEYLTEGDLVGYSGQTGVSVIPHLHLEVLKSYDGWNSVTDFEDTYLRINPYDFIFDNHSYVSIY